VLVCYGLALVTATHWPHPSSLAFTLWDKFLHAIAYGLLAVLMCLNASLRRRSGWWPAMVIVASLAAFGALDEWTQIPFGRRCDFYDWSADLVGIVAGLGLWALGLAIFRHGRRRGEAGYVETTA
jgi:VanZ family protein